MCISTQRAQATSLTSTQFLQHTLPIFVYITKWMLNIQSRGEEVMFLLISILFLWVLMYMGLQIVLQIKACLCNNNHNGVGIVSLVNTRIAPSEQIQEHVMQDVVVISDIVSFDALGIQQAVESSARCVQLAHNGVLAAGNTRNQNLQSPANNTDTAVYSFAEQTCSICMVYTHSPSQ